MRRELISKSIEVLNSFSRIIRNIITQFEPLPTHYIILNEQTWVSSIKIGRPFDVIAVSVLDDEILTRKSRFLWKILHNAGAAH